MAQNLKISGVAFPFYCLPGRFVLFSYDWPNFGLINKIDKRDPLHLIKTNILWQHASAYKAFTPEDVPRISSG